MPQITGTGLEVSAAAVFFGIGQFELLLPQILQVCPAKRTTNLFKMEIQVRHMLCCQNPQQITAPLLASRTTRALPPLDLANGMQACIAPPVNPLHFLQ